MKVTHKYFIVGLLCVLCCVGFAQTKSTNIQVIEGKKYYIHKIEKSQSLYAISKLYSVSLDELYTTNPELKTNGAKAEQEIKIPFASAPPPATMPATTALTGSLPPTADTTKYLTHKIAKGETVYAITRRYNITEKQLANYNPGLTPTLKEGQIIAVGEKNRKKSATKEKENKQVITSKPLTPAPVIDSSLFKPVSKPKKTKYNVALILPFRLDQTLALDLNDLVRNNTGFPVVPALALDLYQGFKRAVDSLTSKEFEVDILLYEGDEKDSVKMDQIVKDPKFKELDLIFGPLYASGFKTVAKRAKELQIPIISPITQQNKLLYNNIYVSKTNPSQFTLLESLADYCIDSLSAGGTANVILVMPAEKDKKLMSEKDRREVEFAHAFKKYYNEKQKTLGKPAKDTITTTRNMSGLKSVFRSGARNVVVTLSANQVFLADFTTQLAMFADKKDVTLCGWQNVSETDNIDQEYLNQLNFTFPYQFNLTNTGTYSLVAKPYIEQQQSIPGDYFYIGFDIAQYYLSHLKENGPDFVHNLNNLPMETNYMRFKYTRPDNMTGFDNRGVYIFRYSNYQLQKTGWK